jgi:hypothetical protein
MDMEFLHKPALDAFLEWQSGVLVTCSGTYQLTLEQKREAVRFFVPQILFLEFRPPDELTGR